MKPGRRQTICIVLAVVSGMIIAWRCYMMQDGLGYARDLAAKADIVSLRTQLNVYRKINGFYPTTTQGLQALVRCPNLLLVRSAGDNSFKVCYAIRGVTTTFTGCLAPPSRARLMSILVGLTVLTVATTFAWFGVVIAVEIALLAGGQTLLKGNIGHPEMPVWMLLVVGAHFWPFALILRVDAFRILAATLCAAAVVSALVASLVGQASLWLVLPGFGGAAVLWGFAGWALYRMARGRSLA